MPVLFEIFIIACGAIMKGLFIPGVTELGASSDSFPSGIVIPGANVMTLPPGEWVDLSDIDLTSSALDYRVLFSCASNHAYYSADGTIQFAAPDVWPLEYRNGVAVGRHEPEMQSDNIVVYAIDFSKWFLLGTSVSTDESERIISSSYAQRITATRTDNFSRVMITPTLNPTEYTLKIVVKSGNASFLQGTIEGNNALSNTLRFYVDMTSLNSSAVVSKGTISALVNSKNIFNGWVEVILKVTIPAAGAYKVFFGPSSSFGSTSSNNGQYILSAFAQLERSTISTSLINTNGISATRAAAFATVQNPGGLASAIMVHYSDNTSEQLEIPTNSPSIQLPQSANDWGKRYIQRIEYIR